MKPSPTQEELLKSSTAVAQKAAEQIGGTFTQGKGFTPKTPLQPTVSANDLVNPTPQVTISTPITTPVPPRTGQIVSNVTRDVNGFIAAQTEEAAKLKDLQATYGALAGQESLSEIFKNTQAEYGVTGDSFKELKDIQLQLTDMDTSSALTKTQIEGAAGQTIGQSQREVTQEDREAAVRSSGLAARAAVLQGNIQTATALAKDTVDIAFKDRQDKATNLINQITMVQGQVDDQTAQLLEQEKRDYEAELSRIEELKTNISTAMVNGASQAEIAELNSSTLPDDQKLALAQAITARGATQMRNLDIGAKQASINASNASAANSMRRQTEIVDVNGVKTLIDSQTGETISTISGDGSTSDAFANALASNDIENVSSILTNSAIGSAVGPSSLARTSPGIWGATKRFFSGALAGGATGGAVGSLFGGIGAIPGAIIGAIGTGVVNASRGSMDQLSGDRQNFVGTVENMRSELTKDKLAQAKGEGVTFGALSDGERSLIANAATKIGNWAITEDGTINSKVTGYDINETAFKREIDTINYFKKLDAVLQGTPPESIGVIVQPDGSMWVANSDGTLSELKRQ